MTSCAGRSATEATSSLASVPDLADASPVGPDIVDPERERVAVHAALHEFLSRSARDHPLLFVIEDLHWASSATMDAVTHIAGSAATQP